MVFHATTNDHLIIAPATRMLALPTLEADRCRRPRADSDELELSDRPPGESSRSPLRIWQLTVILVALSMNTLLPMSSLKPLTNMTVYCHICSGGLLWPCRDVGGNSRCRSAEPHDRGVLCLPF